jgi:hypothetical protein
MPLFQVTPTQPVRIVEAGSNSTLIVNRDLTNSVIYGDGPEIFGNNTNVIDVIDPLGSIVVTGVEDVWAIGEPGNPPVAVSSKANATQWTASPAQIAASISLSGVSAITNPISIVNNVANTIGTGGAGVSLGPFTLTQVGYSLYIDCATANNAAASWLVLKMQWFDPVSGQQVAEEDWWLGAAPPIGLNVYSLTGPVKGGQLVITIVGNGNPASATTHLSLSSTGVSYQRDNIENLNFNGVATFTQASYDVNADMLLSTAPVIGAGSSATRLMPIYSGLCSINIAPPAGSGTITIKNSGDQSGLTATTIYQKLWSGIAANDGINNIVALPRAHCSITISNAGASSGTFSCTIVPQRQPI